MTKEAIKIIKLEHPFIFVLYADGVCKKYDVTQYAPTIEHYDQLKNVSFFQQAKLDAPYTIYFNDDVDLDCDTVYEEGLTVESPENAFELCLGYEIKIARISKNLTQKRLSELTGIAQADISKLEKGLLNPSIKLIKRITDAIGKKLEIKITPRTKY